MVMLGSQTRGEFLRTIVWQQKYLSGGYELIIFLNTDVGSKPEKFFHEIWIQIDYYRAARSENFHESNIR